MVHRVPFRFIGTWHYAGGPALFAAALTWMATSRREMAQNFRIEMRVPTIFLVDPRHFVLQKYGFCYITMRMLCMLVAKPLLGISEKTVT